MARRGGGRGFDPPPPSGIDPAALRSWVADGRLVKVGEVWWSAEAIGEAARRLATELSAHPDGITVAEVRDALDSSRKPTLALLGLFDERGLTRRRDDLRIRGPRLDGCQRAPHQHLNRRRRPHRRQLAAN